MVSSTLLTTAFADVVGINECIITLKMDDHIEESMKLDSNTCGKVLNLVNEEKKQEGGSKGHRMWPFFYFNY
ncbi:hypothetical protein D8B46_07020 [Candidatus Gracilibacteria bacterium]|nr:MAG: hypothetical protein D8B46_07020 [Candidatus Gracilibacteria bacterium]